MNIREVKPIEWDRPTDYEIFQQGIFGGMGPRIDERYGYIPGFNPQTNSFDIELAGRYGLFAQAPKKLTPVQAAAQNFGDIPVFGDLLKTIRDYEDRINYRNADPETRKLLKLE